MDGNNNLPNLDTLKGILAIIVGFLLVFMSFKIILHVLALLAGIILIYAGIIFLDFKQVIAYIDTSVNTIKKLLSK